MTDISKDFEALCEKEFNLARQEAFKDLDREISAIKSAWPAPAISRVPPRRERLLMPFAPALTKF
jgi:hypothetical protein